MSHSLRLFATDWRKVQREKDEQLREKLASERAMLIQDGKPSDKLVDVLRDIFSEYLANSLGDSPLLPYTSASRLWYRCGLKLTHLDEMLMKTEAGKDVCFEDFVGVIRRVVEDDEESRGKLGTEAGCTIEVGDKVELVDNFAMFGDATGGPLQPGDRGIIVEIQEGPNGER